MIVIGLTGSIGMGKSTVAHMMREKNIPVHDSDACVHFLLEPGGRGVQPAGQKFPEALALNEKGQEYIDRDVLGRLVFEDRARKKELEDILHPMVRAESDKFVEEIRARGHTMAALDIPLLYETGAEERVDVVIVVSAPHDVQKKRVLERPGMTSEKFDRVVAGQMPDAEKRKRAHYIIENGGDLDDTRQQLDEIINRISASHPRAAAPGK
ncbi:MAG: dephospho-CoA kinase [Alphaproteobacteria bacterium]|nr:dephospho-CoA kinase [Alphaproteobacteria bacterium]